MYGRVANSNFTRISGSENPKNFSVAFDYRTTPLSAVELLCQFPSPCTTNNIIAAARRRQGTQ